LGRGVVNLHMTKKPDQTEFEYKYLALDVKGQSRIYLENADQAAQTSKKSDGKMFGIKWR
jgi:import inner membrane translocase subunit TIM21